MRLGVWLLPLRGLRGLFSVWHASVLSFLLLTRVPLDRRTVSFVYPPVWCRTTSSFWQFRMLSPYPFVAPSLSGRALPFACVRVWEADCCRHVTCVLKFIKHCPTALQSHRAVLHPCQPCRRILVAPYLCRHCLWSVYQKPHLPGDTVSFVVILICMSLVAKDAECLFLAFVVCQPSCSWARYT